MVEFLLESFQNASVLSEARSAIVLQQYSWNDWFRWRTLFAATWVDAHGARHELGSVKIADLATEYSRTTDGNFGTNTPLPGRFDAQPGQLISIGQDESYYQKMRALLGVTKMKAALRAIGDLALDRQKFRAVRHLSVVSESLLRSVQVSSVEGQFARIIRTGESRIDYEFRYIKPSEVDGVEPIDMDFSVVANSTPPTNVHVLIGRNGAGKTTVMKSMARSLIDPNRTELDGRFEAPDSSTMDIANVVYVAFSAFDEAVVPVRDFRTEERSYSYVGLQYMGSKDADPSATPTSSPESGQAMQRIGTRTVAGLERVFADSAWAVLNQKSGELWTAALANLESDTNFRDAEVSKLADSVLDARSFRTEARSLYRRLSSGHKIVLLTVTKLVETVTEKTLVLLDEPEGHLHPPLLSAFIRTLSNPMRERNGIAIVATHSPVILQEVPQTCVYRVVRAGRVQTAARVDKETFGENVGVLTTTIFGLEVEQSGYHRLLIQAADRRKTYQRVVDDFGDELGFEARATLKAWFTAKDNQ